MNFELQTNEELKALKEAIDEELWERGKVGKQQRFYVVFPYRAENGGQYYSDRTYLDIEEAVLEAYSYMIALYGKGNFEHLNKPGRYSRLNVAGGELVDTRIVSEWF